MSLGITKEQLAVRVARRHACYHNSTRGVCLVLNAARAPPPCIERRAVEVPVQDAAAAPPDSKKHKTVRFDLKATVEYDDALSKEDLEAAAKEALRAAKLEAATRCRPPREFDDELEKKIAVASSNGRRNAEKYMP